MSSAGPVLLVADAGADAGLGHLARSSAVATALRDRGIAIDCIGYEADAIREREGVTWRPEADSEQIVELGADQGAVVLDSYRLPRSRADAIAGVTRLVVMHDCGEPRPGAALTIAPSDPEPSRPGRLNGLRYACLGSAFRDLPAREPAAVVESVLVTTGGGDPGGRASKLASEAKRGLPEARVQLLRGPQANVEPPAGVELIWPVESMHEILIEADLIVTGAGGTMVEACAAGVPALVVVLAPNQAPLAAALERKGAVVRLADGVDLAEEVAALGEDAGRRGELSSAARAAVDGYGALRVAAEIERLVV